MQAICSNESTHTHRHPHAELQRSFNLFSFMKNHSQSVSTRPLAKNILICFVIIIAAKLFFDLRCIFTQFERRTMDTLTENSSSIHLFPAHNRWYSDAAQLSFPFAFNYELCAGDFDFL